MLPFLSRRVRILEYLHDRRWYSSVQCVNQKGEDASCFADFLIKRFGFSKTSAISAAKRSCSQSLTNSYMLESFFNDQGFSHNQIAKIFRARPHYHALNPTKLGPKIEFLKSFLDTSEAARVASSFPDILGHSFQRTLLPSFSYLREVLQSERAASLVVRRFGNALTILPGSTAAQNLEILIKHGVPRSKLVYFFLLRCVALKGSSKALEEVVMQVKNMGFKSNTSHFVIAISIRANLREQLWEKKVNLLKACGWSEEEFLVAFRRNPFIAGYSDGKIKSVFNYLKEVGIKPCRLALYPLVFGSSMEKRVVPRGEVLKVLISKGLISERVGLTSVFCNTEDKFVRKYVLPYDDDLGLAKLYRQKL